MYFWATVATLRLGFDECSAAAQSATGERSGRPLYARAQSNFGFGETVVGARSVTAVSVTAGTVPWLCLFCVLAYIARGASTRLPALFMYCFYNLRQFHLAIPAHVYMAFPPSLLCKTAWFRKPGPFCSSAPTAFSIYSVLQPRTQAQ